MVKQITQEMRQWLRQLVEAQLSDEEVVKGYLKFYAVPGYLFEEILVQIVLKTGYSVGVAEETVSGLKFTLENYANQKKPLDADSDLNTRMEVNLKQIWKEGENAGKESDKKAEDSGCGKETKSS